MRFDTAMRSGLLLLLGIAIGFVILPYDSLADEPALHAHPKITLFPEPPDPAVARSQAIRDAIDRLSTHLFSLQKENGTWELAKARDDDKPSDSVEGGQWGSLTAMATHALLSVNVNSQERQK